MRIRFYSEDDDWTVQGAKITAPETLEAVRKTLEDGGPVIVEHWFYRGACAPARFIVDDFDDFAQYLKDQATAGDSFYLWSFPVACTDSNYLICGKCPDDQGRVPTKGAY